MKRKLFYAFCALTIFSVVFAGCDNGTTGGSETVISEVQWAAGTIAKTAWDDAFEHHDRVIIQDNPVNPGIEPILWNGATTDYVVPAGKTLHLNGHTLTVGGSTPGTALIIAGSIERGVNARNEKGRIVKANDADLIVVNDPWHPEGEDPYESYGLSYADTVEMVKVLPLPNSDGVIDFSTSVYKYFYGNFDLDSFQTDVGIARGGIDLGGETIYIFGNLTTSKVADTSAFTGGTLRVYGTLTTPYLGTADDATTSDVKIEATRLGMPATSDTITLRASLTLFEDSEVTSGRKIVFKEAGGDATGGPGVAVLRGSNRHVVEGTNGGAGKIIIKSGAVCEITSTDGADMFPLIPIAADGSLINDFAGIVVEAGGKVYRNCDDGTGLIQTAGPWDAAPAITTATDPWANSVYYVGQSEQGATGALVPVFDMSVGSSITFSSNGSANVISIKGDVKLTQDISLVDENIVLSGGKFTIPASVTLTGDVGVEDDSVPHYITVNADAVLDVSGGTLSLVNDNTSYYGVILVPAMVETTQQAKAGGGGKLILSATSTGPSISGRYDGLTKANALLATKNFQTGSTSTVLLDQSQGAAAQWNPPAGDSGTWTPPTADPGVAIDYIDASTTTYSVEAGTNTRVPSNGYIVITSETDDVDLSSTSYFSLTSS